MVRRIGISPMHYYPLISDTILRRGWGLELYVVVESIAWNTTVMVCCKVRLNPHPFRTDLWCALQWIVWLYFAPNRRDGWDGHSPTSTCATWNGFTHCGLNLAMLTRARAQAIQMWHCDCSVVHSFNIPRSQYACMPTVNWIGLYKWLCSHDEDFAITWFIRIEANVL